MSATNTTPNAFIETLPDAFIETIPDSLTSNNETAAPAVPYMLDKALAQVSGAAVPGTESAQVERI